MVSDCETASASSLVGPSGGMPPRHGRGRKNGNGAGRPTDGFAELSLTLTETFSVALASKDAEITTLREQVAMERSRTERAEQGRDWAEQAREAAIRRVDELRDRLEAVQAELVADRAHADHADAALRAVEEAARARAIELQDQIETLHTTLLATRAHADRVEESQRRAQEAFDTLSRTNAV